MRKIKHPTGAILDVCDYCSGMWIDGPEVKLLNLSLKSSHNKIVKQGVKQWQKKKIG
jgi:Zn-finger nucleic acid-binding protein